MLQCWWCSGGGDGDGDGGGGGGDGDGGGGGSNGSTKEYKGRTDSKSPTGPNEAVCLATLLLLL